MYNMLEIRFVDIHGTLKAMNIPIDVDKISNATTDPVFSEGINIDGSSVAGFTALENSDLHLLPVSDSLFELPYTDEPKLAVMCEIHQDSTIFAGDTRSQLRKVIEKHLTNKGLSLKVGPEPEFYLFKDNAPVDQGQYADIFPNAVVEGMVKRFSQYLTKALIEPKVHHHEVGPGQYEIEIGYEDALRIADIIVTYKATIRALAAKSGHTATFMPKPYAQLAGNGMHCHLSLWEGSKNLFSDSTKNTISATAEHFMAGILEHALAMTVLVAPTVNSYKRLVPGYEAPVYVAWGPLNRSTLIRVPMINNPKLARFEYRCPDPSCNPYLALISIVTAGMDGIKRELELPPPVKRNIYKLSEKERKELNIKTLPGNLFEALSYLEKDKLICDALGEHICEKFFQLKKEEWLQYSTQVTDWDWKNYLQI
ncbi:MAG: glutamine synthetase [Candidatus Heimdallarchaeota archaeon]|nr:MAG: glutamine synthetase [Candidatus Heimdallarchaeota archaeon]